MRHPIILLCVLSMVLLPLHSVSLASDSGRHISLSGNMLDFSIDYGKASFRWKDAAYGDICRSGLMRLLSDPYEAPLDITPRAGNWTETGGHGGAVLDIGNASFLIASSDRAGAGISISFPFVDASVLFMQPDRSSAENGCQGLGFQSAYAASMVTFPFVRMLFAASVSVMGRIGVLGAVSVEAHGYCLTLRIGQLEQLYSSSEQEFGSFELKVRRSIYSMDFLYVLGKPAVYSFEYQDRRIRCTQKLKLQRLSAEFSFRLSHYRNGHEKHEFRTSVKSSFLSFSFSDSHGPSYELNLPGVDFCLSGGRYEAKIRKSFTLRSVLLEISVSSRSGIAVRIHTCL